MLSKRPFFWNTVCQIYDDVKVTAHKNQMGTTKPLGILGASFLI